MAPSLLLPPQLRQRAAGFAVGVKRRGGGSGPNGEGRPEWGLRPDEEGSSISRHVINWYPGHIAKAEKELQDFLKLVDVVIEARDARIPAATTHPLVRQCELLCGVGGGLRK